MDALKIKNTLERMFFNQNIISELSAGDVCCAWTLLSINYFESNCIADLKIVEGYSVEFLGMKEEIFRLSLARDKSKSSVRLGFYCTFHSVAFFDITRPVISIIPLLDHNCQYSAVVLLSACYCSSDSLTSRSIYTLRTLL